MISFLSSSITEPGKERAELCGLSTDSKPTARLANGSRFIEMDTGKLYFFDEAGSQWVEFGA